MCRSGKQDDDGNTTHSTGWAMYCSREPQHMQSRIGDFFRPKPRKATPVEPSPSPPAAEGEDDFIEVARSPPRSPAGVSHHSTDVDDSCDGPDTTGPGCDADSSDSVSSGSDVESPVFQQSTLTLTRVPVRRRGPAAFKSSCIARDIVFRRGGWSHHVGVAPAGL